MFSNSFIQFVSSRASAIFWSAYLVLAAGCSAAAEEPQEVAVIDHKDITESSGLATSHANPGNIWVHNDSGDKAVLYLLSMKGKLKASVKIDGADSIDWEDMCSFTLDGQTWLLIGDTGDNARARGKKNPKCRLYLVKEQEIKKTKGNPKLTWDVAIEIKFDYEDGVWDCEGVAVDAERREILLLTKGAPQNCGLYSLPLDLMDAKQNLTAKRIASPFILFATALDIAPDGQTMAVGTMLNGLVVKRKPNQSWGEAFQTTGKSINLPPRKQGETICFDQTGEWLYLTSEGKNQPLWRIPVP